MNRDLSLDIAALPVAFERLNIVKVGTLQISDVYIVNSFVFRTVSSIAKWFLKIAVFKQFNLHVKIVSLAEFTRN